MAIEQSLVLFIFAAGLAYIYAFVGGFTDAANAIATSIGSRVLSPRAAVIMAGICNLLGGLTGTAVAVTIGKGLLDPAVLSLLTVIAGLVGAMSWSLFTYKFGIPVSETHGLIGALTGAALATAGPSVIRSQGIVKTFAAIFVSPILGFLGGGFLIVLIYWLFHRTRPQKIRPLFINLQRLSAAYMAFSHGRNDAQKPMGVLALAITLYFGFKEVTVPFWIIISCAAIAALGTAYGGWRIIKTLGVKVTKLDPVHGFAAEMAGATVIEIASEFGIPISTTHAITSSILGVGAVRHLSAVRWGVTLEIFFSWLLTVPVTLIFGALAMVILGQVFV